MFQFLKDETWIENKFKREIGWKINDIYKVITLGTEIKRTFYLSPNPRRIMIWTDASEPEVGECGLGTIICFTKE